MPLPNTQCYESRVIKQLLEALLFEGIVTPEPQDTSDRFVWRLEKNRYEAKGRIGAFGRYRLDMATLLINGAEVNFAHDWQGIIDDLPAHIAVKQALLEELSQTISLCRWNDQNLLPLPSRRLSSYEELEGLLDEGHPYHPSFKARTGFDFSDHSTFGPEAGNAFNLYWVAVKREFLEENLPCEHNTFWQEELGQTQWNRLSGALRANGTEWDEYGLLPIHPWQWKKLKSKWIADELASQNLLFLGIGSDRYAATQSVRTLLNYSDARRANVKLPMNMVNTSSHRNLAAYSVCLAPMVSSWLDRVIASDSALSGLGVLNEYAGARFQAPYMDVETSPEAGQLAVIFRESVASQLKAGESAVPFNALMMVEQDGLPFIAGWVEQYGLEDWLDRLITVAVLPVWHLLAKHGIGIEPHGQNMVLIHKSGWPERILIRDFHESVEYVPSFVREPSWVPDFASLEPHLAEAPLDDYYAMSSVELLRELVMDTLFIYNLAEVSHLIASFYSMSEAAFWQRVAKHLDDYAKQHPELESRLEELGYTQASISTESLMTRKLTQSKTECHHRIPNPLHAGSPGIRSSQSDLQK